MSDQHDQSVPATQPQPLPSVAVPSRPDPGSPRAARIAWIVLITLTAAVVLMQQLGAAEPPATSSSEVVKPEPSSAFSMMARMMTRTMNVLRQMDAQAAAGKPSTNTAAIDQNANMALRELNPVTPAERLRLAIVAGELKGPDEAKVLLDKLEADLKPNVAENMPPVLSQLSEEVRQQLLDDIGTVRSIVSKEDVAPEQRQALIERHGWFGKLSAAFGKPETDPERANLLKGGMAMLALLGAISVGLVVVSLASLVCGIIWMIKSSTSRRVPAFVPPARGGSVYLETVAAFIACFLALKLVSGVVFASMFTPGNEPTWLEPLILGLQWLMLPAIFYPLLRGVSWSRWKADMGWHAPRGVWREIGSGVFYYLAGLPFLLAAIIVTLILLALRVAITNDKDHQPSNPIVEIVTNGSVLTVAMLYLLASVWAPIVEESIFRGAFFRHLRSRLGLVAAALLSALVFGCMHGYEWLMLSPVIALGFVFALMRNRSDSLIPAVAAHALHNGVLLACVLSFLHLAGE